MNASLRPACHPEPAKDLTDTLGMDGEILRLRSQARSAQDDNGALGSLAGSG
jgi:hypothetical protein